MANSLDPDQMPHPVASDLGVHCLLRPICPNTYGVTVPVDKRCYQINIFSFFSTKHMLWVFIGRASLWRFHGKT